MKILSIVIPAYNVEKYLDRCLQSFEVQAVLDKIEILVINDGSTDETANIAAQYCEKYQTSYFLFNKENGGHGSGINYGIKHATGKYFKVVDGDDWLNSGELKDFVELLEKIDTDVVAADYLCVQDGSEQVLEEKYCTRIPGQYGKICDMGKGEIQSVIKMHALTIKTEILKKNHIFIDEHCYYVDCEYITYPMPYVKNVYFYHRFIYMYRLGRGGQSMDIRSMQKNRQQHMRVLESLLTFYDRLENISVNSRTYIEKCIAQVVENQFQIYISMGRQKEIAGELREWDYQLKKNYNRIYAAADKKSIKMLRLTNYRILKAGAFIYDLYKNKRLRSKKLWR